MIVGDKYKPKLSSIDGSFEAFKKDIPVKFVISDKDQTIKTKEGPVKSKKGDAILTGVQGEEWPIPAKKFSETYEKISDTEAVKKKINVWCYKLMSPSQVKVSWSDDLLSGEIGDFLVQYGDNDYGIVGESIFEESYERIDK